MDTILQKTTSAPSDSGKDLGLAVADAVWVGTALLHELYPSRSQFSIAEIVESVLANHLTPGTPTSIRQHVTQHSVANRKAQPNRSCMLYATREVGDPGDTHRRIFRDCDINRIHPDRRGAPTHPVWAKLPQQFAYLRDWYEVNRTRGSEPGTTDPLLALSGTGRGMFGDQGADAYVNSLRDGWADRG